MARWFWPRRWWVRVLVALTLLLLACVSLFVVNGTILAARQRPTSGITAHAAAHDVALSRDGGEITVMAFNIAKGFAYQGGVSFDTAGNVRERVAVIAQVIRGSGADIVMLSEAWTEGGPCRVNQVTEIADAAGMHAWAFGECYNFGIPLFRVVGGNAILSRYPIEAVANPQLAGGKPFYVTRGNRRMLWCRITVAREEVLLGAVHLDSFSQANNLRQCEQLLDYIGDRPALIAGDFNAKPDEPTMQRFADSGRFVGQFAGAASFPADEPKQRIDFVLGPASWRLIETRIIDTQVSDHRPVVARFAVPGAP